MAVCSLPAVKYILLWFTCSNLKLFFTVNTTSLCCNIHFMFIKVQNSSGLTRNELPVLGRYHGLKNLFSSNCFNSFHRVIEVTGAKFPRFREARDSFWAVSMGELNVFWMAILLRKHLFVETRVVAILSLVETADGLIQGWPIELLARTLCASS